MTDNLNDDDTDTEPVGPATQIGIVCAILEYLAKTDDCARPNARQSNAVIAAANDIMDQLRWADVPATAGMGFAAWWESDDTGASSKYLGTALDYADRGREYHAGRAVNYPHDPQDFGRCVKMLDACPGFRELLPAAMADPKHGPAWNGLAARWAELEAMYAAGLPSSPRARGLLAAMTACGC